MSVKPKNLKTKVPISNNQKPDKRVDVLRNEERVRVAYFKLEEDLGKPPTRIQVAAMTGLSRKKVGQYFRSLKLK